jgi:hypothetical protein
LSLSLAFGRGFFLPIVRQQVSAASGWRGERVARRHGFGFPLRPILSGAAASGCQAQPDQFPKTYAVASN